MSRFLGAVGDVGDVVINGQGQIDVPTNLLFLLYIIYKCGTIYFNFGPDELSRRLQQFARPVPCEKNGLLFVLISLLYVCT